MSQRPVVVCEIEVDVDIRVPSHLQQMVLRAVNVLNIGRATVPLDEEWPPGMHGSMERVHHNLAMTRIKKAIVQVMSDGELLVRGFKK